MADTPQIGALSNFKVVLTNFDRSKTVNITNLVLGLTITEDIFKNTLYGSVDIRDALDILSGETIGFRISGQEFLELDYKVDLRGDPISLRFAVYAISNIQYKQNNTVKEYTLSFASEEHLIDASSVVMKSYKKQHSDNLKNLLQDYLFIDKADTPFKGKRIKKIDKLEPTKGEQTVLIPRLSPLQAAQFLARRSLSDNPTFQSATYLFFENFKGFNFCDIEYLIQEGEKKAAGNKNFEYFFQTPLHIPKDKLTQLVEVQTILRMEHKKYFDTVEKLKRGGFESDVIVYDFANQKTIPNRFRSTLFSTTANTVGTNSTASANTGGAAPVNTPTTTTQAPLLLGSTDGKAYPENTQDFFDAVTDKDNTTYRFNRGFLILKDLTNTAPDTFLDQIYPARAAYFTLLAQNMFTIHTYGNPYINAGDVINVHIPAGSGTSQTQIGQDDSFLSGYYMVCTINHQFTQTTYTAVMDIYSNGMGSPNKSTDAAKTNPPKGVDTKSLKLQANNNASNTATQTQTDGNPTSDQPPPFSFF